MPSFATPTAITALVEMGAGAIHIAASDRTDTTVEVAPMDPSNDSDRKAAARTTVDFSDGRLKIVAPRHKPFELSARKSRSVQITIQVPTSSNLRVDAQAGHLHGSGALGDVRIKTSLGDVQLDRSGPLDIDTSAGSVSVGSVSGDAEVSTGSGRVRIERVAGAADIKSSNGDIGLGAVGGGARVRAANGAISVEQPGSDVRAKTANGSIRVGAVSGGVLDLSTSMGGIDVEVAPGVVAKLDLSSKLGRVTNGLGEVSAQPGPSERTAEVRAHTSFGSVSVRRAA